jgi:molybdate transport system substrate-binding protein
MHQYIIKRFIFLAACFWAMGMQAQPIKVAAAADLRYAMDELVENYKKIQPQAEIEVIYGSSGNAYTQIMNGAPFDLYFSADILYPKKLQEAGLTLTNPKLYAIGRIVLWSQKIDVSQGLAVLKENAGYKIATANPSHAPYGRRAIEALKYYGLFGKLEKQMIYGENISQAAQFCLTGNADAGLLALSLVLSPAMINKGNYFLIDDKAHEALEQAFVVLKNTKDKEGAMLFVKYISSADARIIFERYGFVLPK